jgi:hypothetical protein
LLRVPDGDPTSETLTGVGEGVTGGSLCDSVVIDAQIALPMRLIGGDKEHDPHPDQAEAIADSASTSCCRRRSLSSGGFGERSSFASSSL